MVARSGSVNARISKKVADSIMTTNRMEAFSDGVIAIIITIMVLELRVPHEAGLSALRPLVPVLLSYVLSFIYLGIYWNNHHHLLHAVDHVNGRILWANMHLLFWLSLVPFVTGWMGENNFAPLPTAIYGSVLLLSAIAYTILVYAIIADQGPHSKLRAAIGNDVKGKIRSDHVNGRILWANMHLLFWLSLVPFVTGWMGENNFAPLPTAIYGSVLLLSAIAYTILVYAIIADQGPHSKLRAAIGNDVKGKI